MSTKLGREGDGPGEYRRPVEIWPSSGDSALVRDFSRFGGLMVLTPKGELGGLVSLIDSSLSTRNFNPLFVDRAGQMYTLEYTSQGGVYDSARVVRWNRRRGTRDTVTRFRPSLSPAQPPNESDIIRDREGRAIGYRPAAVQQIFAAYNDWAVAPDGRVAVVRAAPYQVSIVALNGSRIVGPAVNYTPVPVTQREKDQYIADRRPGLSMSLRNGVRTTQYMTPRPMGDVEWAEVLPPFVYPKGVKFASDGMLWVKRHTKAGAAPLFDVFDRTAKLAYQVELPEKRQVVGFGAGSVYLARVDDDDLHYLERYALPASRPLRP